MPGWRTVQSYTATMASVRWQASPDQTSCRSRAPVTSSTVTWQTKRPSTRCPRLFWGLRSARWKSPTTARMVSQWPRAQEGGCHTVLQLLIMSISWCGLSDRVSFKMYSTHYPWQRKTGRLASSKITSFCKFMQEVTMCESSSMSHILMQKREQQTLLHIIYRSKQQHILLLCGMVSFMEMCALQRRSHYQCIRYNSK